MADLEDIIRRSVRQKEFNYLSICPDSDNPKLWRAIFRDVTGFDKHAESAHADPVEAIKQAMRKKIERKQVKSVAVDDDII